MDPEQEQTGERVPLSAEKFTRFSRMKVSGKEPHCN